MSKRQLTPGMISGYPLVINGRLALTDFNGKVLGYGRIINEHHIKPGARGSLISSKRVSYNYTVDGKRYYGRGYGTGIHLNLRPFKS